LSLIDENSLEESRILLKTNKNSSVISAFSLCSSPGRVQSHLALMNILSNREGKMERERNSCNKI
jgi:hypothetical protein